ncbi:MAG: dipeptidase [Thermoproteota archaeon]|nr:dipeptidase [Thermoproteota archaeon]
MGITNNTIQNALVELLEQPLSQFTALYVPTAIYAYPNGSNLTWRTLRRHGELGWKEFGILELTALPSVPKNLWLQTIEAVDAIILGGGNNFYLSYWLQQSGLFEMLPALLEKGLVYVGWSAGSMIASHSFHFDRERFEKTNIYYDDEYEEEAPPKCR